MNNNLMMQRMILTLGYHYICCSANDQQNGRKLLYYLSTQTCYLHGMWLSLWLKNELDTLMNMYGCIVSMIYVCCE